MTAFNPSSPHRADSTPEQALRAELQAMDGETTGTGTPQPALADGQAMEAELAVVLADADAARPGPDAAVDRIVDEALALRGLDSVRRERLTEQVRHIIEHRAEQRGALQGLLRGRRERQGIRLETLAERLSATGPESVPVQALREVESGAAMLADGLPAATVARWARLLGIDEDTLAPAAATALRMQRGTGSSLAAAQDDRPDQPLAEPDREFRDRLLEEFRAVAAADTARDTAP